jgi:hypothetical protein
MFSTATLALALCVGASALGAKNAEKRTSAHQGKRTSAHEGKVVSVSGNELVMANMDG